MYISRLVSIKNIQSMALLTTSFDMYVDQIYRAWNSVEKGEITISHFIFCCFVLHFRYDFLHTVEEFSLIIFSKSVFPSLNSSLPRLRPFDHVNIVIFAFVEVFCEHFFTGQSVQHLFDGIAVSHHQCVITR